MKKTTVLLFLISLICFASCQTPQKRAEAFAKKFIQDHLYIPESYEAISTSVDSAFFTPFFDDFNIKKAKEVKDAEKNISKLEYELEQQQRNMREASRTITLWDDFGGDYGRSRIREAREDYNEAYQKAERINQELSHTRETVNFGKALIRANAVNNENLGKFVGWIIEHRYRAETKGGSRTIGETILVVDQSFDKIIMVFDEDDHDLQDALDMLAKILKEED